MQRETSLLKEKKALSVKTRNDADSDSIAAHEMRCDGIGWSNDVERLWASANLYDRRYSWV
jgi:hypothetical protein